MGGGQSAGGGWGRGARVLSFHPKKKIALFPRATGAGSLLGYGHASMISDVGVKVPAAVGFVTRPTGTPDQAAVGAPRNSGAALWAPELRWAPLCQSRAHSVEESSPLVRNRNLLLIFHGGSIDNNPSSRDILDQRFWPRRDLHQRMFSKENALESPAAPRQRILMLCLE